MKKSLQAFRFISEHRKQIPAVILILILIIYTFFSAAVYGQDLNHSVGEAPFSSMRITPQAETAPLAVGTRAFLEIVTSPNVQFAKSFMENCTYTIVGPSSPAIFNRGLVGRYGVIYTWNPSSPFQFWSIDTVTGTYTLVVTLTGVPMANLTGMCWDGTTMWAVATNGTSSQLLSLNMLTGSCTPIGASSTTCSYAALIFGRQFSQSSLFSADVITDNIYKWNKNTGTATLIGPAGFNVTPGEDASYDGNTCYLVESNQLRRWDTTSAIFTVLCNYGSSQVTGIECIPETYIPPNGIFTICRNGINIPVPDNSIVGARDTIKVIGWTSHSVRDINVKIDTFPHTWISDMQFKLTHNGTNQVNLFLNRGGSGDNIIRCELNDSAAIPISSGTAPFTGIYKPEQPLTAYNGEIPTGNWVLFMEDQFAGDLGFLKAWCIVFEVGDLGGGINTIEIPFTYRLSQNYPNPFNPVTTIKFGLPKYGKTSLIIYDILGKVVTALIDNELKDAGTYEVQWDASNYSSGIYFYTLESGTYKETKKMILVK